MFARICFFLSEIL